VAQQFLNGIKLNPQSGDPASPADGQIWFNATTATYRISQGSIIDDVATKRSELGLVHARFLIMS
jgi:hypothetical protein